MSIGDTGSTAPDTLTKMLMDAVHELQSAQEDLLTAIDAFEKHNIDEEAHADIRELIDELKNGDAILSATQVATMIEQALTAHRAMKFNEAHGGWTEIETDLNDQFESMDQRLRALEDWKNNEETGGSGGSQTDFERERQAIELKYKTILDGLYASAQDMINMGNTSGLENINRIITDTLNQKTQEIDELIKKYTTEDGSFAGDPNTYIVRFDANQGNGHMSDNYVKYRDTYFAPACLFNPPQQPVPNTGEAMVFEKWSTTPDVDAGSQVYLAGERLTTDVLPWTEQSSNTKVVTLYAIWTRPQLMMR